VIRPLLFAREARRLVRLARLLWHLAAGALLAHSLLPLLRLRRDPRGADALVRWWLGRLLAILAVRLRVVGAVHQEASLLVANHISWLDIPVVRAITDVAFVSKEDVRRWPIIGAMAARAGTLFLSRGSRDASNMVADQMTWSLSQRRSILIFPEGTTTRGGEVRNFFPRLYQAAIRTRAWVQAVAVTYPYAGGTHPVVPFVDDDTLTRHLWKLLAEEKLDAELRFCEPVSARGLDRRALAEITREQIAQSLGITPVGDVGAPADAVSAS